MTVTCPKGHTSTEEDFCSECGAKIGNVAASNGSHSEAMQTGAENCPDCGTPRAAGGVRFCELCGYNFETGAHGEIPLASVPEPPPPPPPPAAPVEKWSIQVTVDPSLKESASPDPPADFQPVSIAVEGTTLLIGRRSASRGIAPEISLDFDTAVSHRHALITRADGSNWSLRDIGSSNGTRVNGQDVEPMVDVALKPGDRITLGHWTCLTLACESTA